MYLHDTLYIFIFSRYYVVFIVIVIVVFLKTNDHCYIIFVIRSHYMIVNMFCQSEEDRILKEKIDAQLEVLADPHQVAKRIEALDELRSEIRSATSSMTSVPKPLKFLRPHFDLFKKYYTTFTDPTEKVSFILLHNCQLHNSAFSFSNMLPIS